MSQDRWYPVSPRRTSSGAFQAFSGLKDASSYRPVTLFPTQTPFSSTWLEETSLHMSVAVKLGVVGLAEAAVAFAMRTWTFEAFLYTESPPRHASESGPILATRWGAGIRVVVSTEERQGMGRVDLKGVAARVELGQAQASFEIQSVGIRDRRVMAILPGPGRFDLAAFQALQDAGHAVLRHIGENRHLLESVPFQVMLARPPSDELDDHRAVLLAMDRIEKRVPFRQARQQALEKGFDPRAVERIYREVTGGIPPGEDPSPDHARHARQWLRNCR